LQPEKKPAPKKPAPAKAGPSSGGSGKSSEPRVKRVFDMPGQTRDTPGEVRKLYLNLKVGILLLLLSSTNKY
jgi:hypothetical protein